MPSRKALVLVVDDDIRLLHMVQRILKLEGYRVLTAASGEAALEVFGEETPDLMLLDIMMPGMDGYTVCRRVRQFSQIPIIMVTAKGGDEEKVAGLEVKQPGYVPQGKGVIEVRVEPVKARLSPLVLPQQGKVKGIEGIALSSHLREQKVSRRMADECQKRLREKGYDVNIELRHDTQASQKGAVLSVWAETDTGCILGSDRAGRPGRSSEEIGRHVARNLVQDLKTGASVDRYLADQLIPYCALADGMSQYTIPETTDHVETNLWLVGEILGARTALENNLVKIHGVGYQPTPG